MKFNCPHCALSLEAEKDLFGERLDCPGCQKSIVVPKPTPKQKPEHKDCEFCGEQIKWVAKKCKHCGEFFKESKERKTAKIGGKKIVLPSGQQTHTARPQGQRNQPKIETNVKQGAFIGALVCLGAGLAIMFASLWTFFIYVPLILAAFILAIVAMAQGRTAGGLCTLLASILIPPLAFLVLSATRTSEFAENLERELAKNTPAARPVTAAKPPIDVPKPSPRPRDTRVSPPTSKPAPLAPPSPKSTPPPEPLPPNSKPFPETPPPQVFKFPEVDAEMMVGLKRGPSRLMTYKAIQGDKVGFMFSGKKVILDISELDEDTLAKFNKVAFDTMQRRKASGLEAPTYSRASTDSPTPRGMTPAGSGFHYGNTTIRSQSFGRVKMTGEMMNVSGKDYKTAIFTLSAYSSSGRLIDTSSAMLMNFPQGSTKSWDGYFTAVSSSASISRIKVEFDTGY